MSGNKKQTIIWKLQTEKKLLNFYQETTNDWITKAKKLRTKCLQLSRNLLQVRRMGQALFRKCQQMTRKYQQLIKTTKKWKKLQTT